MKLLLSVFLNELNMSLGYGAIPAVVHSDIWELYIEEPPKTKDAATSLALEQFGFCSDIVYQGVDTINALASNLLNSKYWYFWWD